jgi:hypothetical protein
MENDSCQEPSAELAGEGGVMMCSAAAQGDLNWKVSWGPGVVGTMASFTLNGLKGPRGGRGRIWGRGGSRRSSPTSEAAMLVLEVKELESMSGYVVWDQDKGNSRQRAAAGDIVSVRTHFFIHRSWSLRNAWYVQWRVCRSDQSMFERIYTGRSRLFVFLCRSRSTRS